MTFLAMRSPSILGMSVLWLFFSAMRKNLFFFLVYLIARKVMQHRIPRSVLKVRGA
jgi:hypothetical protein